MARCDGCGNEYDKAMVIEARGRRHVFDCFECAINVLAPRCGHCSCRIIGHGVEDDRGQIYCCAHCSRKVGVFAIRA
jgi:hypothetical protein